MVAKLTEAKIEAALPDVPGWKRVGEVTVAGVEKKGDIAGHEALARARTQGEKLAKTAL